MHETNEAAGFTDRPLGDAAADFVMERRWLPGRGGELTERIAYTNVAHHVVDLSPAGYDWGNASPGAHDLALNVLETALRRAGHRGPRATRLEGACFILALLLRGRFAAEFLAALPEEGGTIAASEVERWIAGQARTLDSAQSALLAPRYRWEDGGEGEHWSAAELEQITGEPLHERADGLYSSSGRRIARVLEPHPLDTAGWESAPL
jgi:hypothetical protein